MTADENWIQEVRTPTTLGIPCKYGSRRGEEIADRKDFLDRDLKWNSVPEYSLS